MRLRPAHSRPTVRAWSRSSAPPSPCSDLLALPPRTSTGFWGSMVLLIVLVGVGNHTGALAHCAGEKLRKADEEIEHLAKVAERERIARDLHDLLGHTLSLITLKAELARKLMDRDPQRAKQEMLDVEQTSRAALADVREAISGYRGEGIAAELVRARKTLETAGITVDCEFDQLPLTPAQETVLALALARSGDQCRAARAGTAVQSASATRERRLHARDRRQRPRRRRPRGQRSARHAGAAGSDWRLAATADRCGNPPRHTFAARLSRVCSAKLRA